MHVCVCVSARKAQPATSPSTTGCVGVFVRDRHKPMVRRGLLIYFPYSYLESENLGILSTAAMSCS